MKNLNESQSETIPFVVKDLEQAIATLEKFSNDSISPFALTHPGSQFSLSETIRHVGKLVISSFSEKSFNKLIDENAKAKHALAEAIETLKNCYPLLEKYRHGTPNQKKLAALATEAVRRFNASIDNYGVSLSWKEKIASFFFKEHHPTSWLSEKDKIDLPITAMVHQQTPLKQKNDFSLPTLFNLVACNNEMSIPHDAHSPSKQASDLFRMKAIRLLRDHKIPVKYESLQYAPIRLQRRDPSGEDHQILSLFQTLRPLPGEVIELKGNIKKKQRLRVTSNSTT